MREWEREKHLFFTKCIVSLFFICMSCILTITIVSVSAHGMETSKIVNRKSVNVMEVHAISVILAGSGMKVNKHATTV